MAERHPLLPVDLCFVLLFLVEHFNMFLSNSEFALAILQQLVSSLPVPPLRAPTARVLTIDRAPRAPRSIGA